MNIEQKKWDAFCMLDWWKFCSLESLDTDIDDIFQREIHFQYILLDYSHEKLMDSSINFWWM